MSFGLKRAWSVFWMRFSGISKFGKVATWLASLFAPPYIGRRKLAALHPNGYISPFATIHHNSFFSSKKVFIDDYVLIYQAKEGGEIMLAEDVSIYRNTIMQTGECGNIQIGAFTAIQPHCNFSAYVSSIIIGEHVQVAPRCSFYSYNHGFKKDQSIYSQPLESKGDIVIEDDAWLGVGVTVLDNVKIGKGAVIGAGAVVTSDVPEGMIATGVPAKVIGTRK